MIAHLAGELLEKHVQRLVVGVGGVGYEVLVPLSTFISPSINLDVGHYLNANYNELVDRFGGIPLQTSAPIEDVGYNYGGASLGLEIGKPDRFSVYLRVGLAHGSMTIPFPIRQRRPEWRMPAGIACRT